MLDPIADKAMVIVALATLAHIYGAFWWFTVPATVILMREVLVSGLREYLGSIKLDVTKLAKWKTTAQMFAIGGLFVTTGARNLYFRSRPAGRGRPSGDTIADRAAGRRAAVLYLHGAAVDFGGPDARHRMGLFSQRSALYPGAGGGAMKVLYFAWAARAHSAPDRRTCRRPRGVATVGALVDWLKAREPRYDAAFADLGAIRVAVDQEQADFDAPIAGAREIALFPPVTGG